jgi:hypothetical protein
VRTATVRMFVFVVTWMDKENVFQRREFTGNSPESAMQLVEDLRAADFPAAAITEVKRY